MAAEREKQFYTEARAANLAIWEGINKLIALQREHAALDYGNTLDDGTGPHAGIVKADVGAVVFDTANAFVVVLNAGHATNMAKLL
jgi:hypothetical protein